MKREAAVAGLFYPSEKKTLMAQVDNYLKGHKQLMRLKPVRALIVPHAGYVYSGNVAADAFVQIKEQPFDNVFLIGTSHKARFKGAAISNAGLFETPIGGVLVNTAINDCLYSGSTLFKYRNEVHQDEHSLEVQLPFIQRVLHDFCIVPILIGTSDLAEIKQIAHQLKPYFKPSNLFVISTDFSHYPPAQLAEEADKAMAEIICSNNAEELIKFLDTQKNRHSHNLLTGLCGWSSVLTLLYITRNEAFEYTGLSYEHSGMKLHKDTSRVVGYQAIAVSGLKSYYELKNAEKMALIKMARNAIIHHFKKAQNEENGLDLEVSGVFVSVYVKNELRGCIGKFDSRKPIGSLIKDLAVDAAFFDSRFKAIEADELDNIYVEIALLTPLKLINDISEIEIGRHGIYIKRGLSQGTFLPKVGVKNNWSVEEYLGHCARDKAKIGWEGWRGADIYTYEAMIISDRDEA